MERTCCIQGDESRQKRAHGPVIRLQHFFPVVSSCSRAVSVLTGNGTILSFSNAKPLSIGIDHFRKPCLVRITRTRSYSSKWGDL